MGIDIYASWRGQSETEQAAQITGFSAEHGHVGYLREAYHGEPYATRVLLPEAFAAKGEPVAIPAALLRERLPETIETAIERERLIYMLHVTKHAASIRAFSDFVELCERKEGEAGQPCTIRASY